MAAHHAVVYTTDGAPIDVERLLFSYDSLVANLRVECDVYILTGNDEFKCLAGHPEVTVLNVRALAESKGLTDSGGRRWPVEALYKVLVPVVAELKKYEKILVLDTDTEVLTDGINDLWATDFHGFEILAVQEGAGEVHGQQLGLLNRLGKRVRHRLGARWINYIRTRVYVNSGVLLWDPHSIDRNNEYEWFDEKLRMLGDLTRRRRLRFPDQDFINGFMYVGAVLQQRFNWWHNGGCACQTIRHFAGEPRKRHMAMRMAEVAEEKRRKAAEEEAARKAAEEAAQQSKDNNDDTAEQVDQP